MALNNEPDEDEKRILRYLVYTSTIDDKEAAIEFINQCPDYETYQRIMYRLEHLQPSIHQITNPSQKDINIFLIKKQNNGT